MFLSFVLVVFQYLLHLTVETCIQLGSENLDAQLCCNGSLSKLRLSPLSETAFVIIERYSSFQCFDRTNQELETINLPEISLFSGESWSIHDNNTKSCRVKLVFNEDYIIKYNQTATCEACGMGYSDNGTDCINIDECSETRHNCNAHAQCRDTRGSFECICKDGFYGNGQVCEDVNECLEGEDNCDANAECNNTEGGYECTCREGFSGNGTDCKDIDECVEDFLECHDVRAQCINTIGSYTCTCRSGFTGNGTFCEDIDECSSNHNICHINAYCNNTNGSFICICETGFTGNGKQCENKKIKNFQLPPMSENTSTSVLVLGVSTITAIIFGIFLVLSLCWVSIITLLFIKYLKHGYYNKQVHLGEFNNDKKFDKDFIPVEITCQTSLSDSHQSIDTIVYPMEQANTYIEQRDFRHSISEIQCDTSNNGNWIMSEAKQLGLQQEYLNIVDGHLDVSNPLRWSASTDEGSPDDTFDITSNN